MDDPNEYSVVVPRGKASDQIVKMWWNESLLNSIPNGWIKQAYVQGFDCETITFKKL